MEILGYKHYYKAISSVTIVRLQYLTQEGLLICQQGEEYPSFSLGFTLGGVFVFTENTLHMLSAEREDFEGRMHRKAEQTLLRLSSLF